MATNCFHWLWFAIAQFWLRMDVLINHHSYGEFGATDDQQLMDHGVCNQRWSHGMVKPYGAGWWSHIRGLGSLLIERFYNQYQQGTAAICSKWISRNAAPRPLWWPVTGWCRKNVTGPGEIASGNPTPQDFSMRNVRKSKDRRIYLSVLSILYQSNWVLTVKVSKTRWKSATTWSRRRKYNGFPPLCTLPSRDTH